MSGLVTWKSSRFEPALEIGEVGIGELLELAHDIQRLLIAATVVLSKANFNAKALAAILNGAIGIGVIEHVSSKHVTFEGRSGMLRHPMGHTARCIIVRLARRTIGIQSPDQRRHEQHLMVLVDRSDRDTHRR